MRKANIYLGIVSILIGLLIIAIIFLQNLDLMTDGIPSAGYLPFWVAVGILIVGVIITGGSLRLNNRTSSEKDKSFFEKDEIYNLAVIIGSSVVVLILTPLLGLLISLGIAIGAMTRLLGESRWKVVFTVAVGSTIMLYCIFVLFLNVPLPVGPFHF